MEEEENVTHTFQKNMQVWKCFTFFLPNYLTSKMIIGPTYAIKCHTNPNADKEQH